jgi:hypothetical protein
LTADADAEVGVLVNHISDISREIGFVHSSKMPPKKAAAKVRLALVDQSM